MARIDGTSTLSELKDKLNVSQAWFIKIQNTLKPPFGGSGTPGKKSAYTQDQYLFFKRVHVLRSYGLSLPEIRLLYDKEKEIEDFIHKYYRADKYLFENDQDYKCGHRKVYLNIFNGDSIPYNNSQLLLYAEIEEGKERDRAGKLQQLFAEHTEYIKNIIERIDAVNTVRQKEEEKIRGLLV